MNSKYKNINSNSTIGIIMATIFTIVPLLAIYVTPENWWGLLLKAIFLIIILGTLQAWERYTKVSSFKEGLILNMLWFSGIYFFYPHWIIYIFILLFIFSLGTLKRILQRIDGS